MGQGRCDISKQDIARLERLCEILRQERLRLLMEAEQGGMTSSIRKKISDNERNTAIAECFLSKAKIEFGCPAHGDAVTNYSSVIALRSSN